MADMITKLGFIDMRVATCAPDRHDEADNRVQPAATVDASPKTALNWVHSRLLQACTRHHTLLQALGVLCGR